MNSNSIPPKLNLTDAATRCLAALTVVFSLALLPDAGANTTWNARNDFYFDSTSYTVSPVEFGPWQGATTPAGASLAWGYYAANVNFFDGFPATIGSYFGPGNNTSSNQVLLAMANYQPLGPGQLQIAGGGVSGSADAYDPYAGAAPGFARYASVIVGPAVELGVYGSPWFPYAPQAASGAIWMQPVWLGGNTNQGEGIANVLTWTAPTNGTYTFSGSFVFGGWNPNEHGASVAIVDSLGNIALPRTVGNTQTTNSFDVVRKFSAGDVLQFQVGSGFAAAVPVGLNVNVNLTGNYWAPGAGGGGSGTWSSANTNWALSPGVQGSVIQSPADTLIFGNASGTVTVSNGANAAAGMTFSTDGYSVTNSTITLTGANAASNTITTAASVGATISSQLAGSNGMTKAGTGTLTLTASNSYSGATAVNLGVLNLNSASGSALGSTSSVSVATSATLLVSQSNQVSDGTTVSLSGGTIQRASGVSETFGALNLTAPSTLDYVGGMAGTLEFGDYEGDAAPDFKLTVNNFFAGNVLKFDSDLTSYIPVGTYNTNAFTSTYFDINSISGGFTAAYSGSTFTITAIPEPSTLAAAAGLLALLLAPAGRRLLARPKTRSL